MPYLIYFYRDEEVGRRELDRPVIVGRSPECDVIVRDILLSRRHCRIEPHEGQWIAQDLGSKNGTRIGQDLVTRRALEDKDELLMGKTRVVFHAGAFVPAPPGTRSETDEPTPRRPADPFEALSSTMSGQAVIRPEHGRPVERFPRPQPTPRQRAAEPRDELGDFPTGIPSGAPDSIDLDASQPGNSSRTSPRHRATTTTGTAQSPTAPPATTAPKPPTSAKRTSGRWSRTIYSLRQRLRAFERWFKPQSPKRPMR